MINKALHLLEHFQAIIFQLWERDYNLKILFKLTKFVLTAQQNNKLSIFDNFLKVKDDFE